MKIMSLIIATFVIAMFTTGFYTFTAFVMNANGLTPADFSAENDTTSTMQSMESMYNTSIEMQNSSNTGQTTYITPAPWNLVTGAYDIVMQSLNAPIFFISMIGDLTSKVTGIPTWVAIDLIAIILAIAVWEIVYLIIGRK